jgi:predicted nucleic acid-binding protein
MIDRVFIDTNILVYAFLDAKNSQDQEKHIKAKMFLKEFKNSDNIMLSTQVCNEYYSALFKHKIPDTQIQKSLKALISSVEVVSLTKDTVTGAFEIKNRYNYSYWDSLILASALEHSCKLLYSEDMHSEHIIEEKLKIINPLA